MRRAALGLLLASACAAPVRYSVPADEASEVGCTAVLRQGPDRHTVTITNVEPSDGRVILHTEQTSRFSSASLGILGALAFGIGGFVGGAVIEDGPEQLLWAAGAATGLAVGAVLGGALGYWIGDSPWRAEVESPCVEGGTYTAAPQALPAHLTDFRDAAHLADVTPSR